MKKIKVKVETEKKGLFGKISGDTFPFYEGVCTPVDICKEDYIGN